MTPLRVGVVGLGEVAQVVHLPVLEALSDLYEVAAICDLSPMLRKHVGDRYGINRRYDDVSTMVQDVPLDCVLVLTSDEFHSEAVLVALDAGLHVLVEKPMCLAPSEARAIIEARDRSGCVVMVGYMRRFAPAFEAAKEYLPRLGAVRYARVHDVIGRNQLIIDQTARVIRPDDLPAEALQERWTRGGALVREALGEVPDVLAGTYRLLCGLGSHDLSALRELLGRPVRVAAARQWQGGTYIAALLEYDDFCVSYETGVDEQLRFDAHLEVYGESASFRLQYDTPYVRHLATTLHLEETVGDEYRRTAVRPHFKDPYTRELEAFAACVTDGVPVRTTPEDYVQDMELFIEIVQRLQHDQ